MVIKLKIPAFKTEIFGFGGEIVFA